MKSYKVWYENQTYSYNVEIVGEEQLINDYGTGYGVVINIKRIKGVPDHLILSSARDMFKDEYQDVWNQIRFRMVD